MAQDIRRLGRFVEARRKHLGLNQDELAVRGGPSDTTVSKIELGKTTRIQAKTARELDESLGWTEGSSEAVMAGGEPSELWTLLPDAPHSRRRDDFGWVADLGPGEFENSVVRSGRDEMGMYLVGRHSRREPDSGRIGSIEVSYWAGGDDVTVSASTFAEIVGAALDAAIAATAPTANPPQVGAYLGTQVTKWPIPQRQEADTPESGDLRNADAHDSLLIGSFASDTAISTDVAASELEGDPHVLPTAARRRSAQKLADGTDEVEGR